MAGSWADGFLLEWRRGEDGSWKGLANYRDKTGRRVELKDQNALKRLPIEPGTGLSQMRP